MRLLLFLLTLLLAAPSHEATVRPPSAAGLQWSKSDMDVRKSIKTQKKPRLLKLLLRNGEKKPLDKLAVWAIVIAGLPSLVALGLLIGYDVFALAIVMLYLFPVFLVGVILGLIAWIRTKKHGWKRGSLLAVIAVALPIVLALVALIGVSILNE